MYSAAMGNFMVLKNDGVVDLTHVLVKMIFFK